MRATFLSRLATAALSFGIAVCASFAAHADLIALQMANVPGDADFAATNGLPPDSIRVLTVANSVTVAGDFTGGGAGAGKPVFSDLTIVKNFGDSSPALFLLAARGEHVQTAIVSFYRTVQGVPTKYYTITLEDVSVTSQDWVGNADPESATDPTDTDRESVRLAYSRITMFNDATNTGACYDVQALTTC